MALADTVLWLVVVLLCVLFREPLTALFEHCSALCNRYLEERVVEALEGVSELQPARPRVRHRGLGAGDVTPSSDFKCWHLASWRTLLRQTT